MTSGWIRVGHVAGIEVRVHWSVLPFAAVFVVARAPVAFACGAFLVLVHELGHGLLARREGLGVDAIFMHPFGGSCRYVGFPSELGQIVIAWGGVLAQSLVLVVTFALLRLGFPVRESIVGIFVGLNLATIVGNLLPIAPLDGATCWRIVPYAFRRMRYRLTREKRLRHDLALRPASRVSRGPRSIPSYALVIDDDEAEEIARRAAGHTADERGD